MRFSRIIVSCAALWVALTLAGGGVLASARQPGHQPASQEAVAGEHAAEAEQGEGILPTLARIANFAILVGMLGYFLREPLANHLRSRGEQIRGELVEAARMRRSAEEQLASVNARMQALPAELEALRARGAADIAAEETRIRAAADAERSRLLEQMRRDVEMQVRIAHRALVEETATLATDIARQRIRATMTGEDHMRLLDRYAIQLAETR